MIVCSILELKPKILPKVAFAPTAEAKKGSKASRRSEHTPKPPEAAGRTACKICLSFIFTFVTLDKEFLKIRSYFFKKSSCKKQGLVRKKIGVSACLSSFLGGKKQHVHPAYQ